jgi:GH35 family endo-1,4-beta-xylanase
MGRNSGKVIHSIVGVVAVLLVFGAPALGRTEPVQLGAAVNSGAISDPDPRYRGTLELYDSVTAESAMKILDLEPQRAHFNFSTADAIVSFAEAHGQQVHGHTLAWCEDTWLPSWLRNRSWTRQQLLAVLEQYINTVMSHYRGRVTSWDVVNEAFNADGTLRDCLWSRVIGPDWVEQAFRLARRADPVPLLFYNEIRAEVPNPKSAAVIGMVRDFRTRGVPIDGVGEQMHFLTGAPPKDQLEETIQQLGDLGLLVHISELDVPTWYLGHTVDEKLARQAESYRTVSEACQSQPACFRITTWGFTDRYTWRGTSSMPLPFDVEYRPKPAWTAIQEVLRPSTVPEPPAAVASSVVPPPAAVPPASSSELAHPTRAAPALSARVRKQRLGTWLRRGWVPVLLRVRSGEPLHVELVARVRRRIVGHATAELRRRAERTVHLRLTAEGRRFLRRVGSARLVVGIVASNAAGEQVRAQAMLRIR